MRLIKILLFIIPSMLFTSVLFNGTKKNTVLVCYGKLKPEAIKGYDYVILESKHYSFDDIKKIRSNNTKVFAYMSMGEVNANATHYKDLKNYTVGKNDVWNSYYLNLKSEKVQEVLYTVVAKIMVKGFDGIFLDNIDNFTAFGPQKDQKNDMLAFLKSIKQKFPKKTFLQNAGLDLIPETVAYVDGVAVESVASDYSFKDKTYRLRDVEHFETTMAKLKTVSETYKIPVILIEYADDMLLHDQIVIRIKDSKFPYFIGNIDLQGLPKFKK